MHHIFKSGPGRIWLPDLRPDLSNFEDLNITIFLFIFLIVNSFKYKVAYVAEDGQPIFKDGHEDGLPIFVDGQPIFVDGLPIYEDRLSIFEDVSKMGSPSSKMGSPSS